MPRQAGQRCTPTQSLVPPLQHAAHLDILDPHFPVQVPLELLVQASPRLPDPVRGSGLPEAHLPTAQGLSGPHSCRSLARLGAADTGVGWSPCNWYFLFKHLKCGQFGSQCCGKNPRAGSGFSVHLGGESPVCLREGHSCLWASVSSSVKGLIILTMPPP